ncbi:MAG: efflux RND transporter periplasmic adaptor subunit, partial [Deltaproteobacteria bacterium]|nr:efflux RND transporter periplasmic adaptor subunit [Deltaproteobacteria bacterium]
MKRFLRRNRLLVGVGAGVLAAAIAAFFLVGRLGPGSVGTSNIGEVHKGELVQRVTVAGTVIPRKRTVLMPPYNGYIKKIYVRVGDTVRM